MSKRLVAEFIGTLWLVLGGCGSAVLAAAFPALGIGFVGDARCAQLHAWHAELLSSCRNEVI